MGSQNLLPIWKSGGRESGVRFLLSFSLSPRSLCHRFPLRVMSRYSINGCERRSRVRPLF
jgi:hypothetical protein